MLIFFAHAVHIVSNEVNGLAERIGASTENLNGLAHEFNVLLAETFVATRVIFHHSTAPVSTQARVYACSSLSRLTGLSRLIRALFLSDATHLDLRASVLVYRRLVIILVLLHHGLGFLHELALAVVAELPLRLHATIVIVLGHWRIVFDISITNELLVTLLLLSALLLLLLAAHALHLFFLLTLALSLFLRDALLLFLLASALSLLLLLAALLFSALTVLLFLGGSCRLLFLLRGALSLHLLLSCGLVGAAIGCTASAEQLLDMRTGVNARRRSTEHRLQKQVGFLWLVSRHNLVWLDIELLADDQLRQLDQFDQEVYLSILFGDGFRVELFSLEQARSETCRLVRRSEDIVQVSEGWLREEFLVHLGFLEELSVHLSGGLPKVVSHFWFTCSAGVQI